MITKFRHHQENMSAIDIMIKSNLTQTISNRDEIIWKELSSITVGQSIDCFLSTLYGHTKRAYKADFTVHGEKYNDGPEAEVETFISVK